MLITTEVKVWSRHHD